MSSREFPERFNEHTAAGRQIEVVESLGDVEVRVGVEAAREHLALVAKVALDLEVEAQIVVRRDFFSRMRRPNFSCIDSSDR